MRDSLLIVPLLYLGLVCSTSAPTGEEEYSGIVRATIRAPEESEYVGNALFSTGPDVRRGIEHRFQLFSKGINASDGQILTSYRFGSEVPEAGPYALAPVGPNDPVGFVAYYFRKAGDRAESYVSTSGTITVTSVTEDRVEGTIALQGALYCSIGIEGWDALSWCEDSTTPRPGHEIEISGSFIAERRDDSDIQPL
jgi:hypothetical protein